MDAILCSVPSASDETEAMRSSSLRMRLGVVEVMAKIIEFHIPDRFRKARPWIPPAQRGKVIEFPSKEKKSA